MTLYLTEEVVSALFEPVDAVAVVEESFRRLAAGEVSNQPRIRLPLDGGALALMGAVDRGLGLAGSKTYAAVSGNGAFVVVLFDATTGDCVDAYYRTEEKLDEFCKRVGAEPAETHREAVAGSDVVVTATTSKDPVLRGEWLQPGALVCAIGANHRSRRELDNVVLERATFVCCDSREQAKLESGDLIEPVEGGVLDWLEVHELQDVVAGDLRGRESDDDIVVFKSNGLAAWDVAIGAAAIERARERGVGLEL